jgi:hypothetical protein
MFTAPAGLFPTEARFATAVPDPCTERAYRPLFSGVAWAAGGLRFLQHGKVHGYVLVVLLTLLCLLALRLR